MEWIKIAEKKPNEGDFVLVYGQMKDRFGVPLKDAIDYAWYHKDQDCFTIGSSIGELWEPVYWLKLDPLPELPYPQNKPGWIHPSWRNR